MEEGRISRVSSAARFYPVRLRRGEDPVLSCAIAWGIMKGLPRRIRAQFPEGCRVDEEQGRRDRPVPALTRYREMISGGIIFDGIISDG